jgi:hypothetical protein
MMRLLIIAVCLCAMTVSCTLTRKQADDIKHEAGDVASWFGVPRPIGECAAALAILITSNVHGRRKGHQRGLKEGKAMAATAPPVTPPAAT